MNTSNYEKLSPCPMCGKIPKINYACGEYFIYPADECTCTELCMCLLFNEMHSSEEQEIEVWNKWVNKI